MGFARRSKGPPAFSYEVNVPAAMAHAELCVKSIRPISACVAASLPFLAESNVAVLTNSSQRGVDRVNFLRVEVHYETRVSLQADHAYHFR